MRFKRFSVGMLMAVVGLVALNMAAVRQLSEYDDELMLGVMPTALVLQIALSRLIRTHGKKRAFWAGFLIAGFLALLSFWAKGFSTTLGLETNAVTGKDVVVVYPGCFGADQMRAIWDGYFDVVFQYLPNLPEGMYVEAVIFLIPQMLAGLAGGLLGWLVKTLAKSCRSDPMGKVAVATKD